MKNFTISKESDLPFVAQEIAKMISHSLILLNGEMGAGKTTFVKYLVDELINYNLVNSPTFSLVNEYAFNESDTIYHMDLYRLESIEEALNIGIEEYIDSGRLCIIEWPDLVKPILPNEYHLIEIKILDDENRFLSFS